MDSFTHPFPMNSPLISDIQKLKQVADNVGLYIDDRSSPDTYSLRMALNTSFLQKYTAKQWGVNPKKPIIIEMKFTKRYLACDHIPPISIFQSKDANLDRPHLYDVERDFGAIQWFLKTRLTSILQKNWDKKPEKYKVEKIEEDVFERETNAFICPADLAKCCSLMNLGFSKERSERALSQAGNDWEKAMDLLGKDEDEVKSPKKKTKKVEADMGLLRKLCGMEFNREKVEIALSLLDNRFEQALDILTKSDREFNLFIASKLQEGFKLNAMAVKPLMSMGFKRIDAIEALVLFENDTRKSGNFLAESEGERERIKSRMQKNTNDSMSHVKIIHGYAERLQAMGYSYDKVREALVLYKNDIEMAAQYLLLPRGEQEKKKREIEKLLRNEKEVELVKNPDVRHLMSMMNFSKKEAEDMLKSNGDDLSRTVALILGDRVTNEGDGCGVTLDMESENLWEKKGPFIVNLFNYIHMRFITCPSYCLICDTELDLKMSYKIPVCEKKECIQTYETSACGNIISEIKAEPYAVDLLITFLACAASGINTKGYNKRGVGLSSGEKTSAKNPQNSFEPFPYNLGFEKADGSQDIALLVEVIDMIPSIKELSKYASDRELKVALDKINQLCYPLLRWIIRSNRAHISILAQDKQVKEMNTPWQFQLVNSFPEHESKFYSWKEKAKIWAETNKTNRNALVNGSGSYLAFHGSPVSNWHSIVRTGLRSGFVRGIYHAHPATTSRGYMAIGGSGSAGWKNSIFKANNSVSCISLIEVADMRHDTKLITGGHNQSVNVAMNDELVVTRFLFFYPTGPQNLTAISGNIKVDKFAFMEKDEE